MITSFLRRYATDYVVTENIELRAENQELRERVQSLRSRCSELGTEAAVQRVKAENSKQQWEDAVIRLAAIEESPS